MSYHNASLNFSHAPNKHNVALSEKSLHEIQMQLMNKQELRLRYIQLMNDAQKILGRNEAMDLIKESEVIWKKKTKCLDSFFNSCFPNNSLQSQSFWLSRYQDSQFALAVVCIENWYLSRFLWFLQTVHQWIGSYSCARTLWLSIEKRNAKK